MFPIMRQGLRLAIYNILFSCLGLAVIVLAGEAYFRLTMPFLTSSHPAVAGRFVPEVGLLWQPHIVVRHTNKLDFWTVTRSNSWGFLDREPVNPAAAASGCHIAVVGDSFVEAREVPLSDKLHLQLEQLAAEELPELGVTTSAFGRATTAQANQLAFYDAYARQLRPKLVVLVFYSNDFGGNSPVISALRWNWNPDNPPWTYLEISPDGETALRRARPEFAVPLTSRSPLFRLNNFLAAHSYFYGWLEAKLRASGRAAVSNPRPVGTRARAISQLPGYRHILEGWKPTSIGRMNELLLSEAPPPLFREALDLTALALAQFKERTERDGASLVILSSDPMGGGNTSYSILLQDMADVLGIPVINQHDYILNQGGRPEDAHFAHDGHWNATGHQWAASALLEHLKANPAICHDRAEPGR